MMRTEVKVSDAFGWHWRLGEVIGEEDGDLIVEYVDTNGQRCEVTVPEYDVRHVPLYLTDELLRGAAQAAVDHIRQHAPEINPSDVELAGQRALAGLRLTFGYPAE